jgi:hypothetical protein
MNPEKHRLIHDLLSNSVQTRSREVTLMAGRRMLRYKRWKRAATRGFAMILIVTIATLNLYKRATPRPRQFSAAPPPASSAKYLSDDQLLALFTNTPVGLARVGGRTILIFPRPGDNERFVGRF